jgi:tRNA(Ile)-lysidine synthase
VLVHVDHRMRAGSAAEADHVAMVARHYGRPFVRAAVDASVGHIRGGSPEQRLRVARYDALARTCARLGLATIVTGHTRDDQVETVIMRLFSGAGGLAVAGMRPVQSLDTAAGTVTIARPLLDVPRVELEPLVTERGFATICDPSNDDHRFRRNAVRHDILPALRRHFGGFDGALLRTVDLVARDATVVDGVAEEVAASALTITPEGVTVDRRSLRELHPAVATRVVRRAVEVLAGDELRELTYERVEAVRLAAAGRTGAIVELPHGVVVRVCRQQVVFAPRDQVQHDQLA